MKDDLKAAGATVTQRTTITELHRNYLHSYSRCNATKGSTDLTIISPQASKQLLRNKKRTLNSSVHLVWRKKQCTN